MYQRSPNEPRPQPGVIKSFRTPVRPAPQQMGQQAQAPARQANTAPAARSGATVGTAANPSPSPTTPVKAAPPAGQQNTGAPGARYTAESTSNYTARPRQQGGINVNSYAGSMWTQPTVARPTPAAAPAAAQAAPSPVKPPQQTEAANPLSGTATTQPEDSTAPIAGVQPQPAAKSLGLATRGAGTPAGQDAAPRDPNVGGSGIYARRFANPQSAGTYDAYVRRIFGSNQSTD